VRGIALEPTTDASGPLGVIAFMKAELRLRFVPALFARFFALFFATCRLPCKS
jgi:hypothetical protein